MPRNRPAAVAGAFYAAEAATLNRDLKALLDGVEATMPSCPKALIVPHAGYIYSGQVAAQAYRELMGFEEAIARVVLVGPAHRVAPRGLALPSADAFHTPLGSVPIDRDASDKLAQLAGVCYHDEAHALEHSLEVQLPFLQKVLDHFKVVPLLAGHAADEDVAAALRLLWGGPETLIIISSDLSHFHPYELARCIDEQTVERILDKTADLTPEQACGGTPVNGLLALARENDLEPLLLAQCNSGDTAGSHDRVVGYCAVGFYAPDGTP